jgi:hypothetical protein
MVDGQFLLCQRGPAAHFYLAWKRNVLMHSGCSCNTFVATSVDSPGFLSSLLVSCLFNVKEYFTFSGHRNNMNLCMRQMRCDSGFTTVFLLSGQSHWKKGKEGETTAHCLLLWHFASFWLVTFFLFFLRLPRYLKKCMLLFQSFQMPIPRGQ